jgi:hypothetical protein
VATNIIIKDRPSEANPSALLPDDRRVIAFADFVVAFDASDWKAGQLATRRLRALGFSVSLVAPKRDRRVE